MRTLSGAVALWDRLVSEVAGRLKGMMNRVNSRQEVSTLQRQSSEWTTLTEGLNEFMAWKTADEEVLGAEEQASIRAAWAG